MDFFTGFPTVEKKDAIMIVVDRLTKMIRLIPTSTKMGAQDIANLFCEHILKMHGLPKKIISDRDVKFTSKFW